jgi:hypothetical protein
MRGARQPQSGAAPIGPFGRGRRLRARVPPRVYYGMAAFTACASSCDIFQLDDDDDDDDDDDLDPNGVGAATDADACDDVLSSAPTIRAALGVR